MSRLLHETLSEWGATESLGGLVRAIVENGSSFLGPFLFWSAVVLAPAWESPAFQARAGLKMIGAMAGNLLDRKGAGMIIIGLEKTLEAAFFAVIFHTIGLDTLSL